MSSDRSFRLGSVLVCVIVCLGVATSIMLTSVVGSLRARRQIDRELQMEQTRWLADAGFMRAVQQIRVNSDYVGEIWAVSPAIDEAHEATIEIVVKSEDAKTRVEIVATIRDRSPQSHPTRRAAAKEFIGPVVSQPTTNTEPPLNPSGI